MQTFAAHEKGISITSRRPRGADVGDDREVGGQRSAAEKELDTALRRLALGQSYPQLNSSNNFLNL